MFDGGRHRFEAVIVLDPPVRLGEPRAERLEALERLRRLRCWLDFQEQLVLAEIAADPGDSPQWLAKNFAREEVACALRVPGAVAAERLHTAGELGHRFPAALKALGEGEISQLHARILTEAAAWLDDPAAAEVEAAVLGRAGTQTVAGFRRSVTRAVARLAPRRAEEAHAAAVAGRGVRARPLPDAMGQLTATVTAEDLAAVMEVLNAEATRLTTSGDGRTVGQLRADTLVDLILGRTPGTRGTGGTGGTCGTGGTGGAQVQVTVALSTLTGLDDQPGELAGYGPIPASMARRIAADEGSVWRRLVTDDRGRLLDYGRATYRPPAGLADFVRAFDQRCVFPTCNRRAKDRDLDHLRAWHDNGDTNFDNLAAECP
jgi:hypothetical protein